MLHKPNNSDSAIARHFRHGHVAMTPSLTPRQVLHCLFANKKHDSDDNKSDKAFPLNLHNSQLSVSFNGSAALYQAIKHFNIQSGDAVLLPAYCCGAEIGPFEYLQCDLYFYDVDNELNANTQQIEQLFKLHKQIKLLLLTHYLGFAQAKTKNIQALCEKYNTALLEDCAHALYGTHAKKPLGSFGQSAIFSPRKTIGLLDGGLLVLNTNTNPAANADTTVKKPDLAPFIQRLCYSIQQHYRSVESTKITRVIGVISIALLSIPAMLIKMCKKVGLLKSTIWATADIEGNDAVPIYNTAMSSSMYRALTLSDSIEVKTKRQRNYQIWLSELTHSSLKTKAQPVFPTLPEECCPLYFPLVVNNPAQLVQDLKSYDIESFNWWKHMHPSVDWQRNPVAKKMKSQIIALPLHHQMSEAQVIYAANCVKAILLSSAEL